MPPSPPQRLKLTSRTPKQYTLSWMPPKTTGGAAVHHYAVELEMLTNKGVRRGFKEVWQGVWQGAVAGRTAGVRAAVGLGEG